MAPFHIQERDLDLIILEELHSDSGFASWLANKLGLVGYKFSDARHSVSAKAEAKWGETDVLVFFSNGTDRAAVLIEDKIGARFTERQAVRYHERANDVVRAGHADRYLTLLIAPQAYLDGVPRDDPWHFRISIDEIARWFRAIDNHHSVWRANALEESVARVRRSSVATNGEVMRFSADFSEFLKRNHPEFWHDPITTDNSWGLTIKFRKRPKNIQIAWKINQSMVDLEFMGNQVGKLSRYPEQVGLIRRFASDGEVKTDSLRAPVATVSWTEPVADQTIEVGEAIEAFQRLRPLAIEIGSMPSVVQEATELPRP